MMCLDKATLHPPGIAIHPIAYRYQLHPQLLDSPLKFVDPSKTCLMVATIATMGDASSFPHVTRFTKKAFWHIHHFFQTNHTACYSCSHQLSAIKCGKLGMQLIYLGNQCLDRFLSLLWYNPFLLLLNLERNAHASDK